MVRQVGMLIALGLVGCGGAPTTAPAVPSNTATDGAGSAAPARPLSGTYRESHPTTVVCDDGSGNDCEVTGEDQLDITENTDGSLAVALETFGTNGHTCTFEGTLQPVAAGERYQFRSPPEAEEEACVLTLDVSATHLTFTAEECRYYCGMRAALDSSFARR